MRTIKILVILAIAGFVGLTGFAYLGDMAPKREATVIQLGATDGN
jgi:hypothetical protein